MNLLLPLMTGSSAYSWLGPYFSFVFVALVAHAIIRHRLMDLRLFINRGLAYALAAAVLSALSIAIARLLLPSWSGETFLIQPDILIIAVVLLATLSRSSQRFIR